VKKNITRSHGGSAAIVGRIGWLLRTYWGGSQAEMARELGCSQAAISRVLGGKLNPGKRLLKLIADHSGVEPQWVVTGEGPAPPTRRPSPNARVLPITRVLLPHPPNEHSDSLEGEEFPVAEKMYRPTRCWYEVPPSASILEIAELRLQPHDLLLLDYELTGCEQRLLASDKIVVSWVTPFLREHQKKRLDIGLTEYHPTDDECPLFMETGRPVHASLRNIRLVPAKVLAEDPVTGRRVRLEDRMAQASVAADGSIAPIPYQHFATENYTIYPKDIVAVCISMCRRF